MAKTNGRTKEPKGRTALPNLFADILCFEALGIVLKPSSLLS